MVANLKLHLYICKCNQRKKLTISKGVLLKVYFDLICKKNYLKIFTINIILARPKSFIQ